MCDSLRVDKAELRQRMLQVRDLVGDHLLRSVELWAAVAELVEYATADSVMAFVGAKGEPDTDPLFARIERDGKRLLLPRVEGDELLVGDGATPRSVSRFGISEPTGPAVPAGEVGFVIVPGLAFTTDGRRLGYGRGYYDRFLPRLPAGVAYVGVCFREQLVDTMPFDPTHDVRVQRVISA